MLLEVFMNGFEYGQICYQLVLINTDQWKPTLETSNADDAAVMALRRDQQFMVQFQEGLQ